MDRHTHCLEHLKTYNYLTMNNRKDVAIYRKAAIRSLLFTNAQVDHTATLVDGLLDPSLSRSDRKHLVRKLNETLKRHKRDLAHLEEYSEGGLQSNIAYVEQKVSSLTLFVQVLAA